MAFLRRLCRDFRCGFNDNSLLLKCPIKNFKQVICLFILYFDKLFYTLKKKLFFYLNDLNKWNYEFNG